MQDQIHQETTHLKRYDFIGTELFSGVFRRLNTSSLLCDCQLKWLPLWVAEQTFLPCVNASCAHPQMLKGRSVFAVSQEEFVCGE